MQQLKSRLLLLYIYIFGIDLYCNEKTRNRSSTVGEVRSLLKRTYKQRVM
jgi:hypothetical protein